MRTIIIAVLSLFLISGCTAENDGSKDFFKIEADAKEIDLEELSLNVQSYVGERIVTEGFVAKSVGDFFFGEKYFLHTGKGIKDKLSNDGIAISGGDIEPLAAYTWDGKSYNMIQPRGVIIIGIVRDKGPVFDAAQYFIEVQTVELKE